MNKDSKASARINRRVRVATLRKAQSDGAYVAPMSLYIAGEYVEDGSEYLVVRAA